MKRLLNQKDTVGTVWTTAAAAATQNTTGFLSGHCCCRPVLGRFVLPVFVYYDFVVLTETRQHHKKQAIWTTAAAATHSDYSISNIFTCRFVFWIKYTLYRTCHHRVSEWPLSWPSVRCVSRKRRYGDRGGISTQLSAKLQRLKRAKNIATASSGCKQDWRPPLTITEKVVGDSTTKTDV